MPTPAELLGTAICTAMLGATPPPASLQKHIDWAQAFLDNYTGGGGNTVLSGTGAPDSGLGDVGDFYIDTAAWDIYGPKGGGGWGSGTSMIGPQGDPGTPGTVIEIGSLPPATPSTGDLWIDTST